MSSDAIGFTVVIPLYNKGPHVERALRSVFDQTHAAAEIIVVDDGSTDGGLESVRQFDQVKVLTRSEPGPGGYAARNLGIESAASEWIAFLDADDLWHADHLSSLAEAIAANRQGVGCAFTRPVFIEGSKSVAYPISATLEALAAKPLDLERFLAVWLDARTCPMWTGAVAIRRADLIEAGLFPAGLARRGGDKDLWLRVMARTKAVFAPRVTAEFHQDTVNRVTKSLDHSVQPIICQTIRKLLPAATPAEQRLLKRLSNMEVVYYARYAAGAGAPFNPDSVRALYKPDLGSVAKLLSYGVAGRVVRLLRSSKSA